MADEPTVVRATGLDQFELGESVNDLDEASARAILGDGVYETWLRYKDEPQGTVTVVGIDGGVTLTFDPPEGERPMKSAGHVAYDAFRTEVTWLPEWSNLTDDQRSAWETVANDTMNAAHEPA